MTPDLLYDKDLPPETRVLVDTRDRNGFEGGPRNGVRSESWGEWDYGFEISRP